MTVVTICRTTSEHSFRVEFASLLRILNLMRNVCAWMPGKRAVLMLSHDVSSGPECCKPVTVFKSCGNSGCADVLLTRRAANKEVQYDALVKSQQERVDAAMVSRIGQVERVPSHEVLVQKAAERHHEAKARPENRREPDGSSRKRPSRASQITRLDLSFKGVTRTRVTSGLMHLLDRETPSS